MTHEHRPLSDCPVCGASLITTRLGCRSCGTEIAMCWTPPSASMPGSRPSPGKSKKPSSVELPTSKNRCAEPG